jgi:hypothetical protein
MLTNRQKLDLIAVLAEEESCNHPYGDRIVKCLSLIYTIAHPHSKCKHPPWEKEAENLYKDLKTKNIL